VGISRNDVGHLESIKGGAPSSAGSRNSSGRWILDMRECAQSVDSPFNQRFALSRPAARVLEGWSGRHGSLNHRDDDSCGFGERLADGACNLLL
jgi:hypothetical protein